MELCLLNLLILTDCFLCKSYPCVLFQILSHVINQESHVYSWDLGKHFLVCFLKFWNLPSFTSEISKSQKSELGKFIPNFPLKHGITSTNFSLRRIMWEISIHRSWICPDHLIGKDTCWLSLIEYILGEVHHNSTTWLWAKLLGQIFP